MEVKKEADNESADISSEEFNFSSVGFYMTNGTLVPVNRSAQARYSALMKKEIELNYTQPKP